MDSLAHIVEKFNIDLTKKSPFHIHCGRFEDIPKLFTELGFKVGAEIGVQEGGYTQILLERIPGLKLYGVDLWELYPGYRDFREYDILKSYETAKTKTKDYNCELIKGWSHEVVNKFEDNSLDFVFIDANHAYQYVVQDIANWSKKVRPGGIVYGHDFDDYSKRGRWREMHVIDAVVGWTRSYKIHPWFVLEGNKNKSWMYVK